MLKLTESAAERFFAGQMPFLTRFWNDTYNACFQDAGALGGDGRRDDGANSGFRLAD